MGILDLPEPLKKALDGPKLSDVMRSRLEAPSRAMGETLRALHGLDIRPVRNPVLDLTDIAKASSAGEVCRQLLRQIGDFQALIDPDQEVGLRLVSFGQQTTIHVDAVGFQNPCLVIFFGQSDDQKPMRLVQHVQQLSFLLVAVARAPNRPKRDVGFWTGEGGPGPVDVPRQDES